MTKRKKRNQKARTDKTKKPTRKQQRHQAETEYSPTAYDDALRTMVNDCQELLYPLINELFGESYTGEEKIIYTPNEHFLGQQDGKSKKRITDTAAAPRHRKRCTFFCGQRKGKPVMMSRS